ncbi:MAG: diguanylate cyclase [Oscillospiraceae bacterium]|jgi:diguanylate cyclase (GGDEF)-like protein|nr:diguanylate cyclase [Oscillospiraceae bacterium]
MDGSVELIYTFLRDMLYEPHRASLDAAALSADFTELGSGLLKLKEYVEELQRQIALFADGDFDTECVSPENPIAGRIGSLGATLKQLVWQTESVAQGEYHQRADYLGPFADAFNRIITQLETRRNALTSELERSKQKTRALEETNDMLELVTKNAPQWVCIVDTASGEWLHTNRVIASILSDEDFLPQVRRWISRQVADVDTDMETGTAEIKLENRGIVQYFEAQILPVYWREHNSVAFIMTDVSADRLRAAAKQGGVYRDSLTRQFNRFYGMRLFEQWVEEKRSFAMSFVDIDNLKYVNEKFGHLEGDGYILSVAAILRGFSQDVTVCRIGGDEFMLLAEGWSRERCQTHLEGLRARLMKRNDAPTALYLHSICYGIVMVGEDNDKTPSQLLAIADTDMYAFKREHKIAVN